jgi:ectoine hydroxylase-related dioxygenase (phytanoyl-CoA dioxygenase family)
MIADSDWDFFNKNGYVLIKKVLDGDHLQLIRNTFTHVWQQEGLPCNQHKLLKYQPLIDLIEHPPILDNMTALYGSRTQLLQYDFLYQAPLNEGAERSWHRDFVFPGDYPLSSNNILYLQDMDDEIGPTYVVPGSHRGWLDLPQGDAKTRPHDGEVAVYAQAGDMAIINAAVLHSGAINRSKDRERRNLYMYYGHWWLKRYDTQQQLPWQCLANASDQRLQLLGIKSPGDPHIYEPDALRAGGGE